MKHLIHIGFPKAASTFLQKWFAAHPELWYQHGALAGFYNVYDISRRASLPGTDDTNYKYYVTSDESLVFPKPSTGSAAIENGLSNTPQPEVPYIVSQRRVCEILKDIYPTAKILLITRGFRSFILSGYSQYVRAGGTLTLENLWQSSKHNSEQNVIDYNYIYKLYVSAFGEENLIVLPFELLRDNKKIFIAALEKKLGLQHFEDNIGRINESLSAEELYWYPRISHRVARIAAKLGHARYAKVYGWYIKQTLDRRLEPLSRALCYIRNAEPINETDIPAKFIEECKSKATVFSGNPLYQSYRAEYLLSDPD